MKLPDSVYDISKWGAFKVAAISVACIALLLAFRDATNPGEMIFIQSLVKFTLGSAVIAYAHSLAYTTYMFSTDDAKDLPILVQVFFMVLHVCWFIFWFIIKCA